MGVRFFFAPDDPPGGGTGDTDDQDTGQPPEGTASSGEGQDLVPREELHRLNREAAKYRRERNDLQNRLKAIEDAEKTEVERLKGQVDTLTKSHERIAARERELRVQVLAGQVGVSPDARADASKLLDWDAIADPDSDADLEEALKALVKARPYLRGASSGADGGAGGNGRQTAAGMNEQIRRAAGRR